MIVTVIVSILLHLFRMIGERKLFRNWRYHLSVLAVSNLIIIIDDSDIFDFHNIISILLRMFLLIALLQFSLSQFDLSKIYLIILYLILRDNFIILHSDCGIILNNRNSLNLFLIRGHILLLRLLILLLRVIMTP